MSHYNIEDLIARWKKEQLTAEQVIGQVLLVLREHDRRLREAMRAAPPGAPARPDAAPKE